MTSEYTIPIKFGPNGCQVNLGDRVCRETETLDIINEFNRTYQAKLREIGNIAGGDNLQLRVNLQQDWIRDLTQQNEMLVKIVESLEKEAADKVSLLEKKLESSSLSSEKAHKDVADLDSKVKDLEKRLSESPKPDDVEALQHKLRLKDDEIDSVRRPKALEKSNSVVVELTEGAGEHGRLRKSLLSVQKQYQDASAQLEMKDNVIRDMQRSIDELERIRMECLRETERKDNVINQMQIDMEELGQKCKCVERELAMGKGVIARLHEETAVQEDNCAAEARVKDETIRKLKSEVENWKRQLDEAAYECECKDETIKKLRDRGRPMEDTMDDIENVKMSAKQCNVKLQSKTSQRSLKSRRSSRRRSSMIVAPVKKSPGTAKSKVPVLRKSNRKSADGVPKRRAPCRSVQVDTKSLSSTAKKSRTGKPTRCICVEMLSKSVGTNGKKDSRPSTRCICVGDSSSSVCPSLSAHTQTSHELRELKKSSPVRKHASKRSPATCTDIYNIPLSPRPMPPPKPVQRESKPDQCIYLYNRICHQLTRPCPPHLHMRIPNEPPPIAHIPHQCCHAPQLTCNNVLHEHYKISNTCHHGGIVNKFVPLSDRPPISTFIKNLELNIQRQNECKNKPFN